MDVTEHAVAGADDRARFTFHEDPERIPIAGKDGKTGETLLKTVLAPMFAARNLEVLATSGRLVVIGTRTWLGEEAFEAAWAEGRSLSIEQAIAWALDRATTDGDLCELPLHWSVRAEARH